VVEKAKVGNIVFSDAYISMYKSLEDCLEVFSEKYGTSVREIERHWETQSFTIQFDCEYFDEIELGWNSKVPSYHLVDGKIVRV
jgi:hypothetical protein